MAIQKTSKRLIKLRSVSHFTFVLSFLGEERGRSSGIQGRATQKNLLMEKGVIKFYRSDPSQKKKGPPQKKKERSLMGRLFHISTRYPGPFLFDVKESAVHFFL